MARNRVSDVPSAISGPLGAWLRELAVVVNSIPVMSYFSGASPNSTVTGLAGHLAVNLGSASTDSRIWVKGGSVTVPGQTGWVVLRTLA